MDQPRIKIPDIQPNSKLGAKGCAALHARKTSLLNLQQVTACSKFADSAGVISFHRRYKLKNAFSGRIFPYYFYSKIQRRM
jgi:hypothetical protein